MHVRGIFKKSPPNVISNKTSPKSGTILEQPYVKKISVISSHINRLRPKEKIFVALRSQLSDKMVINH